MHELILDPKYCHIYHLCGIGRHQILQCAGDLWWSPEREECDWASRANCKSCFFEKFLVLS